MKYIVLIIVALILIGCSMQSPLPSPEPCERKGAIVHCRCLGCGAIWTTRTTKDPADLPIIKVCPECPFEKHLENFEREQRERPQADAL
jgi:hypothetical protein